MSEGCGTSDAGDERSVLRGSLGVVRSRQRFSGIGGGGVDPAAETDGGRGVEAGAAVLRVVNRWGSLPPWRVRVEEEGGRADAWPAQDLPERARLFWE